MIRTIFLDFDDTLHDSDSKYAERLNGITSIPGLELWRIYLVKVHRDLVHAKYPDKHDDQEFHVKLLFRYLGIPFNETVAGKFMKACDEAMEDRWKNPSYFPDAIPFLCKVKDLGFKLCLTTGEHADQKAAGIERFARRRFFDHVLGEKRVGFYKGDPRYFQQALALSDSKPEETVCIGDTLSHDIKPAMVSGIKTIWLNRRDEPFPNGYDRPDHETKDLLEALQFLENPNRGSVKSSSGQT